MTQRLITRNSSIELLRILAMFLVLVQHANFLGIGCPNTNDCINNPANTLARFFIQSLSIVAVDVFVLISGWFGIKPNIKKICSLIFQVLFFTVSILIIHMVIYGYSSISPGAILKSFMITKCYWFVKSYICLFILSPILNLFVEKASRKTLGLVLIGFFTFQTIYGWTDSAPEFFYGYSVISFVGLYLLARYLRLYPSHLIPRRAICLMVYLSLSLILAASAWLLVKTNFHTEHSVLIAFSYINPIIILSSLALLFFFTQTEIRHSKVINWIAASSFSVYIIHITGFLFPYFLHYASYIYSSFSIELRWLLILFFLGLVFILCVLLDKIRLFFWHRAEKMFDRKKLIVL